MAKPLTSGGGFPPLELADAEWDDLHRAANRVRTDSPSRTVSVNLHALKRLLRDHAALHAAVQERHEAMTIRKGP